MFRGRGLGLGRLLELAGSLAGRDGQFAKTAKSDKPEIDSNQPRRNKYYDFTPGQGDHHGKLSIKCHVFELVIEDITQLMKDPAKFKRTMVTFPDGAVFRVVGTPVDIKTAHDQGRELDASVMTEKDKRRLNQEKAANGHRTPFALVDGDPSAANGPK